MANSKAAKIYSPVMYGDLEKETKAQLIQRVKDLRKMLSHEEDEVNKLAKEIWEKEDKYRDLEWVIRTREDKIRAACAIFINLNVQQVGPASLVLIQRLLQEALDWPQKKAE